MCRDRETGGFNGETKVCRDRETGGFKTGRQRCAETEIERRTVLKQRDKGVQRQRQ